MRNPMSVLLWTAAGCVWRLALTDTTVGDGADATAPSEEEETFVKLTPEDWKIRVSQVDDTFPVLSLNAFERIYSGPVFDTFFSCAMLLAASAAGGALIMRCLRGRQHGKMPTRSALEREAAYASMLSSRPAWKLITLWAFVATVVWAFNEGSLLFATTSRIKHLTFDDPLEHVVVNRTVNLEDPLSGLTPAEGSSVRAAAAQLRAAANELAAEVKLAAAPPCRRVHWKATEFYDIDADLTVERCWTISPVGVAKQQEYTKDLIEYGFNESVIAVQMEFPTPDQPYNWVEVYNAAWANTAIVYTTAYTDQDAGFVRWADDVKAQTAQLALPIAVILDELQCTVADPLFTDIGVVVIASCPELVKRLAKNGDHYYLLQVLALPFLHHVDLRRADRDGGFAASFYEDGTTIGFTGSVAIGSVTIPRVNLLGCFLVFIAGVILYLVVSNIPGLDTTEYVLQHYDYVRDDLDGEPHGEELKGVTVAQDSNAKDGASKAEQHTDEALAVSVNT